MSWQYALFAVAGVFALAVIAIEPWRARHRIADVLRHRGRGKVLPVSSREHWGEFHRAADRKRGGRKWL